jgi:adenylate cyclase
VWAVGTRYFIEERRRRRLLSAFGHYLSPQMAQRIADADVDLRPGGKLMQVTVMFTDLENYMGLCARMDDPQRIAQVLTTYFTHTTGHILENDGTIIKYMGDAVHAVWGAPLPDADHVCKAVRAAWRLHVASRIECEGHPLRTRIGLNTGEVLAGNLGSAQRFDFAVTGDPVNLASRLEGLNKYLGTDILLSESVRTALDGEFVARSLGRFLVVGKPDPLEIHELLGPAEPPETRRWLDAFARALADFQRGDLAGAERGMRAASELRAGGDGPAKFYLEQIAALPTPLPPSWDGVVKLSAK